tara:strand:+ start:270 stop:749 length:480 start_codon:yes stop_codon:yes gene_type:complete
MGEVGCLKDGNFQNLEVENLTTYHRNVITHTANSSITLTDNDSSSLIFVNAESGTNVITLPAVANVSGGWNIRVILAATAGANCTISTVGSEKKIKGQIDNVSETGISQTVPPANDAHTITLKNGLLAGSWVELYSDGSYFYARGFGTHSSVSNLITFT